MAGQKGEFEVLHPWTTKWNDNWMMSVEIGIYFNITSTPPIDRIDRWRFPRISMNVDDAIADGGEVDDDDYVDCVESFYGLPLKFITAD